VVADHVVADSLYVAGLVASLVASRVIKAMEGRASCSSDHGRRPLLLRDIKIKFMETPAVPSATDSMAARRPEISTAHGAGAMVARPHLRWRRPISWLLIEMRFGDSSSFF
jgi:hypothetical protein